MSRLIVKFVWVLLLVFLAGCQGSLETYTVSYQDYDGSIIQEMSVEAGESVMPPEDPFRDGYRFSGWDNSPDSVQADLIITATYEEVSEETPESEVPEVNQADLPVLVLTYVEGLEDALGDFLDHPFVITDTIIDVDYSDYSRMLVLYEDRLRRFLPPRLLGSPGLDEAHFVTFNNDAGLDVTMLYLKDEAAFPTILDRLNTDIFNQFEPTNVYDYIPVEGTAILEASAQFDVALLQAALGEDIPVLDASVDTLTFNQYKTIYVFLGDFIHPILNDYQSVLLNVDGAITRIENERGQILIVGRSTSEFVDDYYASFIREVKTGVQENKPLTLNYPVGINFPQERMVSADVCYTRDLRGNGLSNIPKSSTTVSHEIDNNRVESNGSVVALSVLINFEGVEPVLSDDEYFSMVEEANEASEEFFYTMSDGQLDFEWVYYFEVIEMPFFLRPELQPSSPDFQFEVDLHVKSVVEKIEDSIDLTNVDLINFFWPVGLPDYVYGGLSNLLSEPMDTQNGEIFNYNVKKIEHWYVEDPETFARNLYHGIAHNLGLTDIDLPSWLSASGTESIENGYEYWDLMAAKNELKAWHRWILGWMLDDQVHCLPRSDGGTHEIFIEPLNNTNGDTRQIVISLNDTEAISIELRGEGKYCNGCTQNILVTHIDTNVGNGNGPMQILRPIRSTAIDFSDALVLEDEFVTYENITITHKERHALGSVIVISFE